MQVKLYGLALQQGAVSLDQFFDHLSHSNGDESVYGGNARLSYVGKSGDYYVVLLLSARDQRRFCELASKEGEPARITVRELKGSNRLVEFNFLLINQNTGRGLFQHYRGSCGIGTFSKWLISRYRIKSQLEKVKAVKEARKQKKEASDINEIRGRYNVKLAVEPFVHAADFATLMKSMQTIRSLRVPATTFEPVSQFGIPATNLVERVQEEIVFKKQTPVGVAADWIMNCVTTRDAKSASVTGIGSGGDPITYSLLRNVESFGSMEFDSIASDEVLTLGDVAASPFVTELMKVVANKRMLFEGSVES